MTKLKPTSWDVAISVSPEVVNYRTCRYSDLTPTSGADCGEVTQVSLSPITSRSRQEAQKQSNISPDPPELACSSIMSNRHSRFRFTVRKPGVHSIEALSVPDFIRAQPRQVTPTKDHFAPEYSVVDELPTEEQFMQCHVMPCNVRIYSTLSS
ncbi:hypothetical protein BGZ60DRAFT_511472 [Tricladium varicosporioides]|nr:hypothetical protein BGZ60DRAFT_511472 [Hymenoscyphus varicosporioides]